MFACRQVAYLVSVLFVLLAGSGCGGGRMRPIEPKYLDAAALPDTWRTRAERTGYVETARYDEIVAFCRRLAAASPYGRFVSFGTSGEGRDLPLLILSKDRAFTPEAAAASGKLVVLVQNCIHAGECEGKDASLELARDILITGTRASLLDHVILLIIPIYNTDGHERFGPYSRINQNGPRESGWRVTATNLNLNRDYTKADAVETQAWLRLWVAWRPDFLFDNHTTDGADYQYDLFYSSTLDGDADPHIQSWTADTLLPATLPKLAADGHVTFRQAYARDARDLSKGIDLTGPFTPRLSTGYAAICNRPTFLVETHMLKPYGLRVRATYDIMLHTLEELNERPEALRSAIRAADEQARAARGAGPDGKLVLTQSRTDESTPITFKAVEQCVRHSEISGAGIIEYNGRPDDVETRLFGRWRDEKTVAPPAAYVVPPQWAEVIDRLGLHGVESFRLDRPMRLTVEQYRFSGVHFAERSYEGRVRVSYEAMAERCERDFAAGTVVIPMNQPRARVAAHLLEPDAPDSLVSWGFFSAIFEQKEYAEAYAMEPVAQRMLEADPALGAEFEERLRMDEAFAKDPGARLEFFYQRSPYFDAAWNVYPVARLTDEAALTQLRKAAVP